MKKSKIIFFDVRLQNMLEVGAFSLSNFDFLLIPIFFAPIG